MKPQVLDYLASARERIERAGALLAQGFTDEAGRAAYLAGFHAAQAVVFERQGRVFKSHNGVQSEFARIVKDEPSFDIEQRAFLGRAYNLKAIADYESGPGSKIPHAQADEAIKAARAFVAAIEKFIGT